MTAIGRARLTTQAQRPGARDATIENRDAMPGSLQGMVRRFVHWREIESKEQERIERVLRDRHKPKGDEA